MPYTLVQNEKDKVPFYWKNCEVEGCEHLVCIGLSYKYCFPHSGLKKKDLKNIRSMVCDSGQSMLI